MKEPLYERFIRPTGKALARTHLAVHRLTRGRFGHQWDGRDVAFITTTGRRTGRPHTIPLAFVHHRDGVAVVASNGGSYRPPDWWLNLQRQPLAEIEMAGTTRAVRARIADATEQETLAETFGQAYPRFERYRRRSRRFIPIVVLSDIVKANTNANVPIAVSCPIGAEASSSTTLSAAAGVNGVWHDDRRPQHGGHGGGAAAVLLLGRQRARRDER